MPRSYGAAKFLGEKIRSCNNQTTTDHSNNHKNAPSPCRPYIFQSPLDNIQIDAWSKNQWIILQYRGVVELQILFVKNQVVQQSITWEKFQDCGPSNHWHNIILQQNKITFSTWFILSKISMAMILLISLNILYHDPNPCRISLHCSFLFHCLLLLFEQIMTTWLSPWRGCGLKKGTLGSGWCRANNVRLRW